MHEAIEPKVIHRDIKSSNILIDDAFNAKVSDFGLAKLLDSGESHITTRVMGTFGYELLCLKMFHSYPCPPLHLMRCFYYEILRFLSHLNSRYVAPEYANTGLLNEKSDIYSFGVLVLEAVTGRDPVDYSRSANEVPRVSDVMLINV